ncbi:MAG: hypothetical protein ACXIUV_06265 [Alkalilacustris sp.]
MDLIADILLGAGAIGAAAYCMVLSRRLKRLTQLESGMGGAIAVLSAQVDDLTRMLGRAQTTASGSAEKLETQTKRAEEAVQRLQLLLSSMHDLPRPVPTAEPKATADPAPTAAPQPSQPRPRVVRRRATRQAEVDA